MLPDLGISETVGEVFEDSVLVGIGLGKSEILGTNMGDFHAKYLPGIFLLFLLITIIRTRKDDNFGIVIQ